MKINVAFFVVPLIFAFACKSGDSDNIIKGNPPAEGFNLGGSDPAAVELADSVMSAMGGRMNWENTPYISWTSSEGGNYSWDKKGERVRIDHDGRIFLINLSSGDGSIQVNGQSVGTDSLKIQLEKAKQIWERELYGLIMPFLLKDTGVTLKYLGEDTLRSGGKCNVLELTRAGNSKRIHVYVDLVDNLVKQWAQFNNTEDDSVDVVQAWDNYKLYGRILLSADRSDSTGPRNVKVEKELPDRLFTDF